MINNKLLAGEKALVTGASKGIGKAIAVCLAEAGADVIINYNSDAKGADDTAEMIRKTGSKSLVVKADVSDSRNILGMFEYIRSEWGSVTILVNNAGISPVKKFLDFTTDEIRHVIDTNMMGSLFCAREALIDMVKMKKGKIINISSVHSIATGLGRVPYAVAKSGMNALTNALSVEFGAMGIQINSLIVGGITNERTLDAVSDELAEYEKYVPAGRWGTCREVAEAVTFLSSSLSDFINGSCIRIDGGHLNKLAEPAGEFREQD